MRVRAAARSSRFLTGLALTTALVGCASPRGLALGLLADQVAAGDLADETDLELARDSAPTMLKMAEALLRELPSHAALARQVVAGFTQYAYAFVAFEAERLQASDAAASLETRRRAARLYRRAHDHALRALSLRHPGWPQRLSTREAGVEHWQEADLVLGYWLAASWAGWISLSKDEPDVVAELPRVVSLARGLHLRTPDLLHGSLASLLATLEAPRPGGSTVAAERLFAQALAAAQQGLGTAAAGQAAAVQVAMAEALAQPAGDRARFEALLAAVASPATAPSDLIGQAMQRRARWLLQTIDERF